MQIVQHEHHDGKFPALGTVHAGGVAQGQGREFLAHNRHFVTAGLYDSDVFLWHGTNQRARLTVEDIEAVIVFRHDHPIADAELLV